MRQSDSDRKTEKAIELLSINNLLFITDTSYKSPLYSVLDLLHQNGMQFT